EPPVTAPQLKFRGTLQPLTSAGTNFHFATALRTERVSVGWVLFTTVNVPMSATPSVSTRTRMRTSALPSFPTTPFGSRFGIGSGSNEACLVVHDRVTAAIHGEGSGTSASN